MPTGKVYLIGAGPGDPGLLTLKGKRCLEEAEVVIYDYLVDQRILAYARPGAELIYVGKKSGGAAMPQAEINQLHEALQGYKEKHQQYGPCMGNVSLTSRYNAFVRHIATKMRRTKDIFRATRTSGVDRRRGRSWLRLPGRRHGLLQRVKVFCGRSKLEVLANPWP